MYVGPKPTSVLVLVILSLSIPGSITTSEAAGYSEVTVVAPAVSQISENEWIGVASWVTVSAEPGEGRIFVDTYPLTDIDTQGSARLAAEAAAAIVGIDLSEVDIFITIRSDSAVIGGPSAGGVISTAILASLLNRSVDPSVVMTGTINPDGTIGPIGGVVQKAEAAHSVKADRFLIPLGQSMSATYPGSGELIDVVEYARKNLGLEVTEVRDIREAARWLIGIEIEEPKLGGDIDLEEYNQIMGEASGEMIDGAVDLYEKAKAAFDSANLNYNQRNELEEYLELAGQRIDSAKGARGNETYYHSASLAFQSKINSNILVYLLQYYSAPGEDVIVSLIEEANSTSMDANAVVKDTSVTSLTAFECYAAAESRAHEATSQVNLAKTWSSGIRSEEDVKNILEVAAYANQRAQSAVWWASLCDQFKGEEEIDKTLLRDVAQEDITDLKYLSTYAQTIGVDSLGLLGEAGDLLDNAINQSRGGAYSAAILSALRSRSYLNAYLEIGSYRPSSNEELIDLLNEKIDSERDYATGSISASRDYGVNPILALAHLENGDNYVDELSAISSPTQMLTNQLLALIEFKIARLIAEMSPVISQRLGRSEAGNPTPQIKSVGDKYNVYTLILVATVFLGGGIIIGSRIGPRRERRQQIYRF